MIVQAYMLKKIVAPKAKTHVIPDTTYWCVDDEFLEEVAHYYYGILSGRMLSAKLGDVDLLTWFKHHDCDNKAMLYKVIADAAFALKYADDTLAQAPAVFYIYYMHGKERFRKGSGHAINASLHEGGKLKFVEPQWITGYNSSGIKELNKHEYKSIFVVGA